MKTAKILLHFLVRNQT